MVNCKGISGAEVLREEVLMKESQWSGDVDLFKGKQIKGHDRRRASDSNNVQ